MSKVIYLKNNQTNEYNRCDVYWCDLPEYEEQGSVQAGLRPVVIVGCDLENIHSPVVKVVALTTSTTKAKLPQHINIHARDYDGLNKDGVMLCEQILSVPKSRLLGHICKLNDLDKFKVDKALGISLQTNKINSVIGKEIDEIVEEIKYLESYIDRTLSKGNSIKFVNSDLIERQELLNKFINICERIGLKFWSIHDYKVFDRKLNNIIRENSFQFA